MSCRVLLAAMTSVFVSACGESTLLSPPERPADLTGVVVALEDGGLRVDDDEELCDVIFWRWEEAPIFVRNADGDTTPATVTSVAVGSRVRAWGRGPIEDSCPSQWHLAALEVLTP